MRLKVGVIGCGNISEIYLKNLGGFDDVEVAAVADSDPERARARAQQFGISGALTVEALLAEPDIEIVLNLTIPQAHFEIAMAVLAAGKSVYNEKPLAIALDKLNRAVGANIDNVPFSANHLAVFFQRCVKVLAPVPAGKAIELVEPMCSGQALGFGAEVPLAEDRRRIARTLEQFTHRERSF